MKRKQIISMLLIVAMILTLAPMRAIDASALSFGDLDEEALNDLLILKEVIEKMVKSEDDYYTETTAFLSKLDEDAMKILENNGFVDASGKDVAIQELLQAANDVFTGNASNGASLTKIMGAVLLEDSDLAQAEARKAYDHITDCLPDKLMDRSFAQYGATKTEKADLLWSLVQAVYTGGDKIARASNGKVEFFLPAGYIDTANDILSDVENPIVIGKKHEAVIKALMDVISEKVDRIEGMNLKIAYILNKLELWDTAGASNDTEITYFAVDEKVNGETVEHEGVIDKANKKINVEVPKSVIITGNIDYTIEHPTGATFELVGNYNTETKQWKGILYVTAEDLVTEAQYEVVVKHKADTPSGGGSVGGGGGGAPSGTTVTITANQGGTIKTDGATIKIPANAMANDFVIKVGKVKMSNPHILNNMKLLSDIFEITKDEAGKFLKPITITLPFDKSKFDAEKYELAIFWLNEETKEWVKLDNVVFNLQSGTVSGDVDHFTKFAVIAVEKAVPVVPVKVELTDIKGHWAAANILKLVETGAISGYPDKTFRPNNNITRAEFATVLVKAFKLEQKTGKVFADTANHWAKDSIAAAAAYGIVSGYDANKFGPNDLITREQMAAMIVKAAGLDKALTSKEFIDSASISAWAVDAVDTATEQEIIKGYPDNSFRPQGKATRAEAVTVIVNALK